MRDLMVKIFGEYQLQYNGENLVGGIAGLDYAWLLGAALFAIAFYGLFRLLGVLLSRSIK